MKESETMSAATATQAKREAYLNQHIYGNANRLAELLRESGALDVPGYWHYPDEEEDSDGRGDYELVDSLIRHGTTPSKAGYCVLDFEDEVCLWGRTSHGIAMYLEESFIQNLQIA